MPERLRELVDEVVIGAVVGPTGVGKTELVEALACLKGLRFEVVAADVMTAYRRMDIGTAKPVGGKLRVHLTDLAEPWEEMTLARYLRAAEEVLARLRSEGKKAVIVGGSGLYFRGLVEPLCPPPHDPTLRARLEARVATEGVEALYEELSELDPEAAAAIEPKNARRIVRALEVCELTGRRFSEFSPSLSSYRELPFPVLGLAAPRDLHRELLLERLCDMFERGLVEEATCIEASGGFSRTAARAHGYLEALAVARGEMDAKEAIEAAFVRIWRYVRRQMQWFRRDPRIVWLTRGSRRLEPQLVESAHAVIAEGRR